MCQRWVDNFSNDLNCTVEFWGWPDRWGPWVHRYLLDNLKVLRNLAPGAAGCQHLCHRSSVQNLLSALQNYTREEPNFPRMHAALFETFKGTAAFVPATVTFSPTDDCLQLLMTCRSNPGLFLSFMGVIRNLLNIKDKSKTK